MNKSEANSKLLNAFGDLPQKIANLNFNQQLGPLMTGLGMGNAHFDKKLANATGPMAGLIKYIRQSAPEIMGETSALSNEAKQAIAGMPNYKSMLQAGSDAASQTLKYAQDYAQQVNSPIQNQSLYQQTMRDALDAAHPGMAARGTLDSGGAQQTESRMARDLGMQFAGRQRQDQLGGNQQLGLASGLVQNAASGQLSGLSNMYNTRQAFNQMPLQLAQNLQGLYSGGSQGATQLVGATAPQVGQSSKGFGIL